ncbi:MAG: DUF2442 domain-containing protein [Acidobacteria bacterium]|nr:MAG: DUF2442 domain-containing protein [Acidobacteriota bacterium]REK06298.1 MAG: DUF2442 domain-containing protein [Acidobacteriota bacterium]
MPGTSTFQIEVTNISGHGFWILVSEGEFFLPFDEFPWFRDASVAAIANVEMPHPGHLFWPSLDIDLSLDSIRHPEKYPLVARVDA